MLVDYRKLDTFMHRLNPRISLMFVLGVIIASIIWTDPIVITVATAGLVALGFACKFPWKQIGWFLKMALGASALIIIIQGFSLDPSLVTKDMYKGWVLFYALPDKRGAFMLDGTPAEVFAQPEILATAYVQPTDITRIAQALDYMPNDVTSVDEFVALFNDAMKEEV